MSWLLNRRGTGSLLLTLFFSTVFIPFLLSSLVCTDCGPLPCVTRLPQVLMRHAVSTRCLGMRTGYWRTSSLLTLTSYVLSILRFQQGNITDNTYTMLTRTSTSATTGSTANSLEGIHSRIHDMIRGGGHMSDTGVASEFSSWTGNIWSALQYAKHIVAFDPIFHLHHANVNRMLSLWAALNPDVWVSQGSSGNGTFTIPAGGSVDTSTRTSFSIYHI